MKCADFRAELSFYADDALEAERALLLRQHLRDCPSCAMEHNRTLQLRSLLREAGRVAPPPELALALRVRLSQERNSRLLDRIWVRVQNMMAPVAVPAFAGLLAAVLVFAVLIHTLAIPTPAQTDDIPLALKTPPRLNAKTMMVPLDFNTGEQGISVELRIDDQGRIIDFRPLNGPLSPNDLAKLKRTLLFTTFDPATTFGVPRPATTIINLSSISVKG